MIRRQIVIVFLMLASNWAVAQDVAFARKTVDTLTSSYFRGRGYTDNGMRKAADYIARQFKSYGLQPLSESGYLQQFSYPVNIFPDRMEVSLNGKRRVPGKDFIVSPDSKGTVSSGQLQKQDSITFVDPENKVVIVLKDKLTWSVAPKAKDYTLIQVDRKAIAETPKQVTVSVDNEEINSFDANNICGMVKGTKRPDSIVMISAHYDHLGGMGKDTYFPGANDNASGVSMVLGLARYYAANPQPYTMVFVLFGGEEAGLIGSKYFTEHPLVQLDKIRFLTNVDMVGTGVGGATVVNGQIYTKEYSMFAQLNNEGKYLVKVNSRGKAANSDHYWFTEIGVPAFFIYTLGGTKAYHDVFDVSATLPLSEYEDLFQLLVKFNKELMN